MKRLLLVLSLLIVASNVSAALGDNWIINRFRYFPRSPVKVVMLDENPALQSRLIIYHTWGAYYFSVISADTVIIEGYWGNEKSVEPPSSVFRRFKSMYVEDQEWDQNTEDARFWFRSDGMFGIRMSTKRGPHNGWGVWAWTMVGGKVLLDTLHETFNEAEIFMDETGKLP